MVAASLAVLLVLLVGVVHTPVVRARVLSWAVARLATDAGLRVQIDRLDYNLLTLSAGLSNITIAAENADTPFFVADAVRIDLPWTIVGGTIGVESLEFDRPRISIARRDDGTLNLPEAGAPAAEAPSEPPGPIPIGRLLVRDLGLRYEDRPLELLVDGRGVTLDLRRDTGVLLDGRLSMSDGVTIQSGDTQTQVSRLDGRLAFDGSTLTIDGLTLEAPEAELRLDGTLDLLAGEQRADLRYTGSADLGRLAPWLAVDPAPSGVLAFSGTAEGPLDRPALTVEVSGDQLTWSELRDVSLRARAALSDTAATVESFQAALASGEVTGEVRVPFDQDGAGRAELRWRDLDVGTLAILAAPDSPVRLATAADGSASLTWAGQDMLAGTGTLESRLRATAAGRDALAVTGRAELTLGDGTWTLTHDHRVGTGVTASGSATGRIDAGDPAASTLDGGLVLRIDNLRTALDQARAAGVPVEADALADVSGEVSADARLAGTLGSPRANGTLEINDLYYGGTGPGVASAGFAATTVGVAVERLRLAIGPNTIDGRAAVDLDTGALNGELTADLPGLESLAAAVPAAWRPDGAARLDARVSGTLDNPTGAATLASDGFRVAGQTVQQLRTSLRMADGLVTVDELELVQDGGRLTATGSYALSDGRYSVELSGDDLAIAPLLQGRVNAEPTAPGDPEAVSVPLDARFDLRFAGEGTVASPQGRGFLEFSRLAWDRYQFGTARVDAMVDRGSVRLTADVPRLPATLQAELALDAPRSFTAHLSLADASLPRLARPAGPAGEALPADEGEQGFDPDALAGAVSLDARASGQLDDLEKATASLDLRLVDVTVNGAPVRLARPARLGYDAGGVVADDFELRFGETVLSARGRLGAGSAGGDGLRVSLAGSVEDLIPFVRLAPGLATLEGSGSIDLQARAAGALDAPALDAEFSIDRASFATGTLPAVSDIALTASYARGLLDLRELRAAWQGAAITASGQIPAVVLGDALPESYRRTLPDQPGPARATLRVASLTQRALAPFVSPAVAAEITGRVDAVVTIEAASFATADVRADVTLERAELELARVPLNQARPTRLQLADGRLEVVEWAWTGAGNQINVGGSALLTGETPQLDLAVTGMLDLRMLGAFSPDLVTDGLATLDVTVTGAPGEPIIDGQVGVQNGDIIVRDPRVAITDLQGMVVLASDRLELRDVTASANGGTLQIGGEIQYPGLELTGGTIVVSGRGLAFEIPENLRSEVDADLQLHLSGDAPSLTGSVAVLRGSYREPVSLTAQLLTGVETRTALPAPETEPGLADRIVLGIDVTSAEDIIIDNNYGRINVGSNLKVLGTLGAPVLTGRLTIQEGGDIFLGGRTYEVARGTVDFTNPTRIEPEIDLALETRVQRYDITLEVTGTPETIEANLRSPGVSTADVVSLLLTGELADESTAAQTEIARGQLLMLLSGELLSFAGRAVGLDTVQISRGLGGAASDFDLLSTDTDPSSRLTIGKNLSRDVELVFSQSLSDTGEVTWIAIYRPLQNIELRGTTQDDGSRSYEFRNDLTFGEVGFGSAGRASRPERTERPTDRVADVQISGTPGFDERELRNRLRLKAGDRFDFYRWQEDRDRLQAFYHQRGFLEARIAVRRRTAPDPSTGQTTVTLEYAITRGPETVLTVEGYELPGAMVTAMKDAWGRAVFDGFLLEDLETMAGERLQMEGYLQAAVTATVVSGPDAAVKEIAVRIAPGPRYADRRISFSGQEHFSAEALEEVVRSRGLENAAWLDPTALKNGLEQHYRSQGFVDAQVTVDAPVFLDQSATLPVRVDEGPQFVIASVAVRGADAKPEAEVRDAFGVLAGSPYLPAALEPARRDVELAYLRDGYNDVRVSVTTLVDRERARVDLAVELDEGRQQVLADVQVTGATLTSRGTIDRALDLEPGSPANLSDYYRAQKRLYDTGVFRTADVELEPIEESAPGAVEPVRANVTLEELAPYRLRYGFRLTDEVRPVEAARQTRPALVVDLLRRNLFGRAVSTGVAGQLEKDRRLARGIVALPQLFGLPVTTNFFLTRSRQDFTPEGDTPFVEDVSDMTAEQRFRPSTRMAVTYGYSFSRTHIFDPDPAPNAILPPLDFLTNIARLIGAYAWDRRDDAANASTGWFQSSGLELGTASLGSDLRFIKYLAQQYYFRSVGNGLVLASALRVGAGRGFDQDLIPSEKFFAGGGTSVRGFAEDGLGESDFFGAPRGGNGLLLLNQEVRFPVFGWARGIGFVDAGNVFRNAGDISLTNLEAGAGLGLRIHSPFALVRIDYGLPLTSRERQPRGRWYFGIGQTF